jgi:hypothetical protein
MELAEIHRRILALPLINIKGNSWHCSSLSIFSNHPPRKYSFVHIRPLIAKFSGRSRISFFAGYGNSSFSLDHSLKYKLQVSMVDLNASHQQIEILHSFLIA